MSGVVLLAVLAWLSGCTTEVTVEGSLPTPVVARLPLRVGVHYLDEFRSFRHEEKLPDEGTYKVDMGAQNLRFFDRLFGAMFDEVVKVDAPPLADATLDLVIVPQIEQYGLLSPGLSGLSFYAVSIHYRMNLLTPGGEQIASWVVVGYGKSPSAAFREGVALNEATMTAIRDGGARIALETRSQPQLVRWLAERDGADG